MLSILAASAMLALGPVDCVGGCAASCHGTYPTNTVDSTRRTGFNGREWHNRPVIGGVDAWASDCGNPGPEAYGAWGQCHRLMYVRVGNEVIAMSPWTRVDQETLHRFEIDRDAWLRRHNYTGGVRTFTNDLYRPEHAGLVGVDEASLPTPRATIFLPPDMPLRRPTPMVDAGMRISKPEYMAPRVAEVRIAGR